jgi:hypothetical protein
MGKKDSEIVSRVVQKVLKDFDFEVDDALEANKEEIEASVRDEILENIDEEPPYVDWIEMVELDEAEAHKNRNGDFLSN